MSREYVVRDDGMEPQFDEFWESVVTMGRREVVVRCGVTYERDPVAGAALDARQNAAILELLTWVRDNALDGPSD